MSERHWTEIEAERHRNDLNYGWIKLVGFAIGLFALALLIGFTAIK